MIVPPVCLEELQLFKKIQLGKAAARTSVGKLNVVDSNYIIITSWNDVPSFDFKAVVEQAVLVDEIPRKLMKDIEKQFKLYSFQG